MAALPKTVKKIAVLDRTKEPGAAGEPLYQDVVTAWPSAGPSRPRQWPAARRSSAAATACRPRSSRRPWSPAVFDELTKAAAQAAVHRRHRRRRDPLEPGLRSRLLHRGGRRDPGRVLRPGQRRHGQRQPQLGEDRRREHAAARPGLFRLRLAQGRLGHHLARALQPAADQGLVPGAPGQLRGLPPVPLPGADRHALDGRAGGDVPVEQPLRPGRGLGPPAGRSAEADHRQEAEVLRGRRLPRGPRGANGRADQHDHADLLLQAGQRDPGRRGDRRRSRTRSRRPTARRAAEDRQAEQRGRGRRPGGPARGEVPAAR